MNNSQVFALSGIVWLVVASVVPSYGQQFIGAASTDTARTPRTILVDPGMTTGRSMLILPPSLQPGEPPDDLNLFSLWKQSSFRPPLLGRMAEPKADLMAAFRTRQPEGWVGTMKMVLGTIQFGGASYLAYRALKSKENPKPIKKK